MLDETEILNIVNSLLSDAEVSSEGVQQDREMSLDYYLGNKPVPVSDGRSSVVSTDVADAIEWILPQMMESIVGKGGVINFDAINPQDEEQAALETEFTHYVFMNENNGFTNLYTFCWGIFIK